MALLLAATVLSGCSRQNADAVFLQYVDSLRTGNIETALTLVLEPGETRRKEKLKHELGVASDKMQAGKMDIIVYEVHYNEPWALIVYGLKLKDGAKQDARIKEEFMYFDGSQWHVVPPGVRSDSQIIPLFRSKQVEALFSDFRKNLGAYNAKYLKH